MPPESYWPTTIYQPTPADVRRQRAEHRRNRLGKVALALLLLIGLAIGCWPF